jgi:hypothetical protein
MTQVKKKSNKLPLHTTPRGRTEWAKLWTPDTKFNVDGEYGTKLVMDNSDATDIMAMLDEAHALAIDAAVEETGKARNKIRVTDPYDVNPETGDVTIKLKLKAKVTTQKGDTFEQKPAVFDAKRQPIHKEIPLWNGSLVRISFQIISYYTALAGAGLSLRMRSVQVIEALAGSGESASMFDDEDGYEHAAISPDAQNFNEETLNKELQDSGEYEDVPF